MTSTKKTKKGPHSFEQRTPQATKKPLQINQVTVISGKGEKSALHARTPPPAIAQLLELLNLLPVNLILQELLDDSTRLENDKDDKLSVDEKIDAMVEDWPDRLKTFVIGMVPRHDFPLLPFRWVSRIFSDEDGSYYRHQKRRRFDFVVEGYNLLRQISQLKDIGGIAYWTAPASESVSLDEQGILVFSKSEIAQILEGVEGKRIRRCSMCSRFFWANHGAKQTCSGTCSTTLRVRHYREKNKDEIKRRRIERENNKEQSALAAYSTTNKGKE